MYKQFFAAFKRSQKQGNTASRQELISEFTDGRTDSLKELTAYELNELTIRLNQSGGQPNLKPQSSNLKADKMRKAIISIFYRMDKNVDDAVHWAESQGVGGIKKKFNDYSNQELYKLIIIAEKILADFQNAIRTRLKNEI